MVFNEYNYTHPYYYIGVQLITELASQVDEVMPRVVEAALALKRSPGDPTAKSRLDAARMEWAQKVQQLTAAIDDIIDPEDFMAVSGRLYTLYMYIALSSFSGRLCITPSMFHKDILMYTFSRQRLTSTRR